MCSGSLVLYSTIRVFGVEADGDDAVLGMMVQGRVEERLNVRVVLEKQRMFLEFGRGAGWCPPCSSKERKEGSK